MNQKWMMGRLINLSILGMGCVEVLNGQTKSGLYSGERKRSNSVPTRVAERKDAHLL